MEREAEEARVRAAEADAARKHAEDEAAAARRKVEEQEGLRAAAERELERRKVWLHVGHSGLLATVGHVGCWRRGDLALVDGCFLWYLYQQIGVHARPSLITFLFLIHRSHSISFTRAQDIPKYKLELGKGEDGRFGEGLVEGGP